MGFIRNLQILMSEESPAMEAEDITKEVGNDSASLAGDKENDDGEISLNTDDILGLKENKDNSNKDKGEKDNTSTEEDSDQNTQEDNPDTDNDEIGNDLDENEVNENEDSFSITRKKKIWRNLKTLYGSLDDSINLIMQYVPNMSDADTIRTLGDIKENLIESKRIAFQILKSGYKTMSYPEMQKKYIGLNHIYDLISKELDDYFEKYKKNQ